MRFAPLFGSILSLAVATTPSLAATPAAANKTTFKAPESGVVTVAFVITDGANVIDFSGPWEVFQDAMEHRSDGSMRGFKLFTVGDAKAPVQMTGGLTVVPEFTFDDAPPAQVIVVGAQRGSPKMIEWLQKTAKSSSTDALMSVCTGAFKLAKAGLLDGKRATTHHDYFDDFAKQYPNVALDRGARFVQSDPHLFTAGGLTSGIDLALHIVELYYGAETAKRTASYMEYHGAMSVAGASP